MKKAIAISFLILASLLASGRRVIERTYVSTDRDCYVAGDDIWISAFCSDAADGGRLSRMSSVVYVELCSEDGALQQEKIALVGGRGSGRLTIPRSTPTGNYRLLAYSAVNKNEIGYDYFAGSKVISVYNTFSGARSRNVDLAPSYPEQESYYPVSSKALVCDLPSRVMKSSSMPVTISSAAAEGATLSISVFHDDGLVSSNSETISSFAGGLRNIPQPTYSEVAIPEYDGEIISLRATGSDKAGAKDHFAFISAIGDLAGAYSRLINDPDDIKMFTNNIYGNESLVCQIEGLNTPTDCHLDLISPFVSPKMGEVPQLTLSRDIEERLSRRGVAMQVEHLFAADTLMEMLPYRENLLFSSLAPKRYVLDDYTRFPLMKEVIVEFVKEARVRKSDKKSDIQVMINDFHNNTVYLEGAALMMVDGVPVFDHETILNYDPLLVQYMDIYQNTYYMGSRAFSGIVNFITYKKNLTGVTFDENVRIIDFKGCCWPMAYTCQGVSSDSAYPDFRQTAYWHPSVDLGAGGSVSFDVSIPAYSGRFIMKIEGLTESGAPVYELVPFEVE